MELFFVVLGFAVVVSIVVGQYFLTHLIMKWLYGRRNQRDSDGTVIDLTPLAKTHAANLPRDISFVAGIGAQTAPQMTLNEPTLRPTVGLRLVSVGISGVLMQYTWISDEGYIPDNIYVKMATTVIVLYSLIYTTTYNLRYDRDVLIDSDWLFRRREILWKDVVSLQDNGHYSYVIGVQSGKSVEVMKYMTGIREFLATARQNIALNQRF